MCRILIHAEIRPMGYRLTCCAAVVVFGRGKNFLYKSILGRCVYQVDFGLKDGISINPDSGPPSLM